MVDKSTVRQTVDKAFRYINIKEMFDISTRSDSSQILKDVVVDPEFPNVNSTGRWECKINRDGFMGSNIIENFEHQMLSSFEIGREPSRKKMRAASMRRELEIAHPSQYILPSEQQIIAEILSLYRELKLNDSENAVMSCCPVVYEKMTGIIIIFR